MVIEVSFRFPRNPDATTRALHYLYDIFHQSEEVGGSVLSQVASPEPIRFARYLLDNPEKWKEIQEFGEQADKLEREKQK